MKYWGLGLLLQIILASVSLPVSDLSTLKEEIVLHLFHLNLSVDTQVLIQDIQICPKALPAIGKKPLIYKLFNKAEESQRYGFKHSQSCNSQDISCPSRQWYTLNWMTLSQIKMDFCLPGTSLQRLDTHTKHTDEDHTQISTEITQQLWWT